MKILLDARMYGLEHAGIGRYVENLVEQLMEIDKKNEYILLARPQSVSKFQISNFKFQIVEVDISHYSVNEQTKLPKVLKSLEFDLAHFPHFNVPVLFRKPYVITIHDLIKHVSRGAETTTRNPLLYWAKYAGYKTVFGNAIHRAKKIIVPSKAVKEDLLKNYGISSDKVEVIYEGVGKEFQISNFKFQMTNKILDKYKIKQPYVIYTGSVYPHKNLEKLVEAAKAVKVDLLIASARNVFINRLQKVVEKQGVQEQVKFLGYVEDSDLVELYQNAKAFVFPSLAEGFGLPGVEAMAAGCPVICSDIPVFHEIYADAAVYFDPKKTADIADKIRLILADGKVREDMVSKGKEQAKKYSWRKMAEETQKVYESCGNI